MPASIRPDFTAHRLVRDHEADRIGDLFGLDQTTQLGVGKHMFGQIILAQRPQDRRIRETRMNDRTPHAMEDGFLHQGGCRAFERRPKREHIVVFERG